MLSGGGVSKLAIVSEFQVIRGCGCVSHSPLSAIDRFSGSCGNDGTCKATKHPWQSMQIVDPTCILELEILLQEGLRMEKTVTH